MMHVVLSRIITLAMMKKIQENGKEIHKDVALALNTVCHATRLQSDL
jgi:hypothetical protein